VRTRRRARGTDPALAAAWHAAVVHRGARCLVCGVRGRLEGHHVLSQQAIRSYARTLRLSTAETQRILWDSRNGVAVCVGCHARHTNAVERVSRRLLPAFVFAFVEELDKKTGHQALLERVRREYPERP
jgi:hypothetical protein